MEATVSIVIPAYNHARYVSQAIDCALGQTYVNREVIVVDDGSTDETQAVLSRYENRIINVRQTNAGLSAARNAGLAVARGEYVLFLDADDLIPHHKLDVQVKYLDAHPELGLTYSAWQHIDASAAHVTREVHPRREGVVLKPLLRREFFPAIGSVLMRRRCIDEVGVFDPALRAAEDMDMWLRIALAGYRFGYQDEVLFFYRELPGSMSTQLANQLHYELRRIDKFFSSPTLPPGLAGEWGVSVAAIYFEYVTRYLLAQDEAAAQRCLGAALFAGPELADDEEWIVSWLSGSLNGIEARRSFEYLDRIVQLLPGSVERRERVRRRAYGRMHADLLYRAHDRGHRDAAWQSILPALTGEPRFWSNRGFWKVALASIWTSAQGEPS